MLAALFLTGCAKLNHLEELLTLQELSIEQDRQIKFVEGQNGNFDRLLKAMEDGSFSQYTEQRDFLNKFGPPVYSREVSKDSQVLVKWVYRYSNQSFDSEKVYLYFDREGKLVDWKHVKPGNKDTEG